MKVRIIAGLGNPGKRYESTRHNVGFMTLDALAEKWGLNFKESKFNALVAEKKYGEDKLILVKAQTFMNLSGQAISPLVNFYKAEKDDILLIFDDVDIHLGSIRFKARGSAGTHNGVKSVVKELGYDDFSKLKLSVGRRPAYMDMADFVLSRFSDKEMVTINEEVEASCQAVLDWLNKGSDFVMNRWNSWSAPSLKDLSREDMEEEARAEDQRKKQDDFRKKAKWCGM